ncbi:hypothetical protein OH76DRAFT_1400466 [Lentinus brumalis]|uniref:Uncharacterized protein n=1 Tax=Lentinus brumalis TaxID=2498619 RepID=A0A371DHX2_9APHY|nr:hypothetical protein OH76DRAFT_1400466 [Polyporus brumalis]
MTCAKAVAVAPMTSLCRVHGHVASMSPGDATPLRPDALQLFEEVSPSPGTRSGSMTCSRAVRTPRPAVPAYTSRATPANVSQLPGSFTRLLCSSPFRLPTQPSVCSLTAAAVDRGASVDVGIVLRSFRSALRAAGMPAYPDSRVQRSPTRRDASRSSHLHDPSCSFTPPLVQAPRCRSRRRARTSLRGMAVRDTTCCPGRVGAR